MQKELFNWQIRLREMDTPHARGLASNGVASAVVHAIAQGLARPDRYKWLCYLIL